MADNENGIKVSSPAIVWTFAIVISTILYTLLVFGSGIACGLFWGQKQFYIEHWHNEGYIPLGYINGLEKLKIEKPIKKEIKKKEK